MKKRTILASIDVGTTKVCTTIAEVDGGDVIRVAGVGVMTLLLINLRLAVCPQRQVGMPGGQIQSFDSRCVNCFTMRSSRE